MALLFPLIAVGAMYLLLVRPQQQRVARQRALVQAIQVGDEVVTAGGIVGRVTRLDDERAWIDVAPGVELTLLRGAIAQRMVGPTDEIDDDDDDDDAGIGHVEAHDDVPEHTDRPDGLGDGGP
jgi:preprotein translocase subunit YajC